MESAIRSTWPSESRADWSCSWAVMAISDIVITGGALLSPSERAQAHPSIDGKYGPIVGSLLRRLLETPIPQDFAGFTHQFHLQTSGMTSYLFGRAARERLAALLPGGHGREGPAAVFSGADHALGGRPPDQVADIGTRLDVAGDDPDFLDDRFHRLKAQLRLPVPLAPGTIGDHLDIGPGQGRPLVPVAWSGSAWWVRRWRSRRSIRMN